MNKEFIPYEQALELKQLGFNEPCYYDYNFGGEITNKWAIGLVPAPLYQQAFRWFREKYHLIGGVEYIGGEKPNTTWWDIYVVGHYNVDYKEMSMKYQPYEEAELACLKKLIEIVKNERK